LGDELAVSYDMVFEHRKASKFEKQSGRPSTAQC
jgi:hypothetical protein